MSKVFVSGHRGLVGSALVRALERQGGHELILRRRADLDLLDQRAVRHFLADEAPEVIYVAAAKVGGIQANNTDRYDFLYENLVIAANLIEGARLAGIPRLLFLGSSCIYPRAAPQPMREEHLLTSALEPTNEPYAIAKIAGVKLVENCNRQHGTDYLSAMPTNLYGPGDTYDLENSHVLPALIRKFHEAKLASDRPVLLWGSGAPFREFLHADDLAEACVLLMDSVHAGQFPGDLINVGSGSEVSIKELATIVQRVVGHRGEIRWDASRPDGTPRKLMDSSRMTSLGWRPRIDLETGIRSAYADFLAGGGRKP